MTELPKPPFSNILSWSVPYGLNITMVDLVIYCLWDIFVPLPWTSFSSSILSPRTEHRLLAVVLLAVFTVVWSLQHVCYVSSTPMNKKKAQSHNLTMRKLFSLLITMLSSESLFFGTDILPFCKNSLCFWFPNTLFCTKTYLSGCDNFEKVFRLIYDCNLSLFATLTSLQKLGKLSQSLETQPANITFCHSENS